LINIFKAYHLYLYLKYFKDLLEIKYMSYIKKLEIVLVLVIYMMKLTNFHN